MADVLTYRVSVAPVVDGDVVTRELSVYVNGADTAREIRSYEPAAVDLGDVLVEQGTAVVLKVVDVDDAGNRSEPAVLEFVATDTLPPAQPGSLGVTLVAETTPSAEPVSDETDESSAT